MGKSGRAEELKHEEKKELRHWALSRSDSKIVPLAEIDAIEEVVRRRVLQRTNI